MPSNLSRIMVVRQQWAREFLAELISTFILVSFGIGSAAQKVLSRGQDGSMLSINFAGGMALTFGIYWAGGVSGGHMNPALSLAFAVARKFPWKKLPLYAAAQFLGAFIASAAVYGIYYDALNQFDGGTRYVTGINATAGIFSSYPQPFLSHAGGFFDQVFGTALLVGCIFAVLDKNNNAADQGTAPLIIGFILFVIGATFGHNCGYTINPARDLSPRIFTAMAGWGTEVFSAYDYWFYVPLIGQIIGGPLGALTYLGFIELHHPVTSSKTTPTGEHHGQTADSHVPDDAGQVNAAIQMEETRPQSGREGDDIEVINDLPVYDASKRKPASRQTSLVDVLRNIARGSNQYGNLESEGNTRF